MRARARTDERCLASETAEELWWEIWRLCESDRPGLGTFKGRGQWVLPGPVRTDRRSCAHVHAEMSSV